MEHQLCCLDSCLNVGHNYMLSTVAFIFHSKSFSLYLEAHAVNSQFEVSSTLYVSCKYFQKNKELEVY